MTTTGTAPSSSLFVTRLIVSYFFHISASYISNNEIEDSTQILQSPRTSIPLRPLLARWIPAQKWCIARVRKKFYLILNEVIGSTYSVWFFREFFYSRPRNLTGVCTSLCSFPSFSQGQVDSGRKTNTSWKLCHTLKPNFLFLLFRTFFSLIMPIAKCSLKT